VSGAVRDTLAVGRGPIAVAVGHGAAWVLHFKDGTAQRIDLNTRTIGLSASVGRNAAYLAVDSRWLWATVPRGRDPGQLVRVDPDTGAVVPPRIRVGPYPAAVEVGGRAVWVVNSGSSSVMKFDARTGGRLATVDVGGSLQSLAVSHRTVWVPDSGTGTVIRIDAATARIVGEPIHVGREPTGVAVGAGTVWVANAADDTVSPIDVNSGRVGASIPVGREPGEIAAGEGALWVVNESDGSVTRIDPRARRIVGRPIEVGRNPAGLAAGGGSVWIPNVDDDTVSRIEPG
jgi:virginiamycin B lyase